MSGEMSRQDKQILLTQWRASVRDTAAADTLPTQTDIAKIAGLEQPSRERLLELLGPKKAIHIDEILKVLGGTGNVAQVVAPDAPPRPPVGPSTPTSPTRPTSLSSPSNQAFALFDLAGGGHARPTGQLSVTGLEDGSLSLAWTPSATQASTFFRVVTDEGQIVFSPDFAECLAVTQERSLVDSRPFTRAERYVTVWMNTGPTDAAAYAAQPTLVGATSVVAPPTDVLVQAMGGRVTGTWGVKPGITAVHVTRSPRGTATAAYEERYRIRAAEPNLKGFEDNDCEPGQSYDYRFYAAIERDGWVFFSDPVIRTETVAVALAPVTDLTADARITASGTVTVDLSWTAPRVGLVQIYVTADGPAAGAELLDVPTAALSGPDVGLTANAMVVQPTGLREGRTRLEGLPWPDGLARVFYTPVTVVGNLARIGTSKILSNVGSVDPTELRIVQRVDWQRLTFAWPHGATEVIVFTGHEGVALAADPTQWPVPTSEITLARYKAEGGLRFESPLPARGCDVHVVGTTYYANKRVHGLPTTVRYAGLLRIDYRLFGGANSVKTKLMRGSGSRNLEIRSKDDVGHSPTLRLVLVYHPERLPLSAKDGEPLVLFQGEVQISNRTGVWAPVAPIALDRKQKGGYLRLFADVPPAHAAQVAILDPPLHELLR